MTAIYKKVLLESDVLCALSVLNDQDLIASGASSDFMVTVAI